MNKQLFARKCDITGQGMNEGFVFGDGDFYCINEEDALNTVKDMGYTTLQEAYDDEVCYWTEWDDVDDYQYVLIDEEIIDIEEFVAEEQHNNIIYVSSTEMHNIIETRKPLGKFFCFEGNYIVGCDNTTGDAWTEDFKTLKEYSNWLNNRTQRYDVQIKWHEEGLKENVIFSEGEPGEDDEKIFFYVENEAELIELMNSNSEDFKILKYSKI